LRAQLLLQGFRIEKEKETMCLQMATALVRTQNNLIWTWKEINGKKLEI
jgi:hypothetical protein